MGCSIASACCPRANARSGRGEAAAAPAREHLEPDHGEQHHDHDAAEGEDHVLEARRHVHERQLQQHDHDERDREHDLLGDERAGERRGRHVGADQLEPALQHRDAPDLAEARGQQRVEQEADEERRHDVARSGSAAWPGIVSSAAFQTTALSRIETRLSASDAITHHQATSTALTVLMLTERSASSSSTPKSTSPATMRQGAVRLAGALVASSETVTSS